MKNANNVYRLRKLSNGEIMTQILRGCDVSVQYFHKNDSIQRLFHSEISYYKNILKPNDEERQKLEYLNKIKDKVNNAVDEGIIIL